MVLQNKFLQFLGLVKKAGKLIEGYNKCEELIKKGKISLLIMSLDCSMNTKEKFIRYCIDAHIPYIETFGKEELGLPIGREEISLLGVIDKKMSDKLLSLWNEQNQTITRG